MIKLEFGQSPKYNAQNENDQPGDSYDKSLTDHLEGVKQAIVSGDQKMALKLIDECLKENEEEESNEENTDPQYPVAKQEIGQKKPDMMAALGKVLGK